MRETKIKRSYNRIIVYLYVFTCFGRVRAANILQPSPQSDHVSAFSSMVIFFRSLFNDFRIHLSIKIFVLGYCTMALSSPSSYLNGWLMVTLCLGASSTSPESSPITKLPERMGINCIPNPGTFQSSPGWGPLLFFPSLPNHDSLAFPEWSLRIRKLTRNIQKIGF